MTREKVEELLRCANKRCENFEIIKENQETDILNKSIYKVRYEESLCYVKVYEGKAHEGKKMIEYLHNVYSGINDNDACPAIHYKHKDENATYFIVLEEAVKGNNLNDWLTGENYSFCSLVRSMKSLCDALKSLHRKTPPLVHCDLKPDNILFDSGMNRIRIIDFDSMRIQGEAASLNGFNTGYTDPEVLLGNPTINSDIYSIGKLLERYLGKGEDDTSYEAEQVKLIIEKCVNKDYNGVDEVKAALTGIEYLLIRRKFMEGLVDNRVGLFLSSRDTTGMIDSIVKALKLDKGLTCALVSQNSQNKVVFTDKNFYYITRKDTVTIPYDKMICVTASADDNYLEILTNEYMRYYLKMKEFKVREIKRIFSEIIAYTNDFYYNGELGCEYYIKHSDIVWKRLRNAESKREKDKYTELWKINIVALSNILLYACDVGMDIRAFARYSEHFDEVASSYIGNSSNMLMQAKNSQERTKIKAEMQQFFELLSDLTEKGYSFPKALERKDAYMLQNNIPETQKSEKGVNIKSVKEKIILLKNKLPKGLR